jgi:CO dehydrogenase/acetyl-CoA synthase epsilon subunit
LCSRALPDGGYGLFKGTYDVLIFLGVVSYLGDGDGTGDILAVLGLTYRTVSAAITEKDIFVELQT